MWVLQVANYVPKKEAGILLYNSLKGELEEELEDAPVESIYCDNGVAFIVDTIRKAVETRAVHLKRRLLADYEHIYRGPQEGMRPYVNRYQRTERSLSTVSIDVEKMYDKEARGARLLERSKLSHEHQRQVLIRTMQSLDFETVKVVLLFQWPDHRPPPPQLGGGHQESRERPSFPPRPSFKGDRDKGKGKGKGKRDQPRAAFMTSNEIQDEHEDTTEPLETINEEPEDPQSGDEAPADDDFDPEDYDDEVAQEIHQILTVTARKLSGIVQARKYGTPPGTKKSIDERKRTSHCAACGAKGHWKGDPECPASSKAKGSSKGGSKDKSSGDKPKTVHFVNANKHHSDDDLDVEPAMQSHQIFMTGAPSHQICLADAQNAAGYLILDTACQRVCAGSSWVASHETRLGNKHLGGFYIKNQESFEFGTGPTMYSTTSWCFPTTFGSHLSATITCILEANIPCLASRPWMSKVGAILMENPQKSRLWDLPEIQRLAARDDVYVVQGHSGAYGATNSRGDPEDLPVDYQLEGDRRCSVSQAEQ